MDVPSTESAHSPSHSREPAKKSLAPLVRFAAWTLSIAAVWLIVLPWLAIQPSIDSHVQWLEKQGVDPSAMYYTELEAMKPILQRFNDRRRKSQRQLAPGALKEIDASLPNWAASGDRYHAQAMKSIER